MITAICIQSGPKAEREDRCPGWHKKSEGWPPFVAQCLAQCVRQAPAARPLHYMYLRACVAPPQHAVRLREQ